MPGGNPARIWPMIEVHLTGRRRYRRQKWTGRMILQVEEEGTRVHFITGERAGSSRQWRDATYLDLIGVEDAGERRGDSSFERLRSEPS